ncbi:MAG: PKD domain-containing protein [Candidatus Neomarinimicrobiota bacterium]
MKLNYLLTVILLFTGIANSLRAQSALSQGEGPDTLWTRTFGGSDEDGGYCVQQTIDGGYIITGYTRSYGVGGWLIKTDSNGETLWTSRFGGHGDDRGMSVQQTPDYGYIIAGYYYDPIIADESDVWLIKTDSNGDTLWIKTFGGTGGDATFSVQQTTDSGYIITGYTRSYGAGDGDVWLIKTDTNGDTLWTRTFGGSSADFGRFVQQTVDGGFIVTGWTWSYGEGYSDVWLIKTDINGDTLWTKTFGGSDEDEGHSVQQTMDGGYIITGETRSYGAGYSDVWLIKTDSNGDTLWTKTFGDNRYDGGRSVKETKYGNYIITGFYDNPYGYTDVYLIKTDINGDVQWEKTFGGNDQDLGLSVQQTKDNGYVITGITYSYGAGLNDVWLIKTSADEYEQLVVDFSANTTEGRVPLTVQFADLSYPMGHITSWAWDFNNDGTMDSQEQNPVWTYTEIGLYTVSLTVSDGVDTLIITKENYVTVNPPYYPVIACIVDVPQDQGRHVYLNWSASYHDPLGGLTQYSIQLQNPHGEWVDLGTVTARQAESYTYLAATFGDSSAYGLVWSRFQVTAHTTDPAVYYTSPMDSGYSIDNLIPAAPTGLVASVIEGPTVSLVWNGPVDYDFDFFRVYRQAAANTNAEIMAETYDPALADTTVERGQSYDYWVSAMDINGNESGYSQAVSVTVLGTEESPSLPTAFTLHQNYPNPFNHATTLRFALPRATSVQLVVYDLQGRETAVLLDGPWPTGYHHVVWDGLLANGQPAPSGVYIVRLVTALYSRSIKMILMK